MRIVSNFCSIYPGRTRRRVQSGQGWSECSRAWQVRTTARMIAYHVQNATTKDENVGLLLLGITLVRGASVAEKRHVPREHNRG